MLSAPTQQSRLVAAKIAHIAKVKMDIRQKRAATAMKPISETKPINATQSAIYHMQLAEERIAHKMAQDEANHHRLKMKVARNLRRAERHKRKAELEMVSGQQCPC